MANYRAKPVAIEAAQWTGENIEEVSALVNIPPDEWEMEDGEEGPPRNQPIVLDTLQGDMTVQVGDWIIKGVKGEFYPCKPDIFEATYAAVEP